MAKQIKSATKPAQNTTRAASVLWVRGIEGDSGTIAGTAYVGGKLCFVTATKTGMASKPITVADAAKRMANGLTYEAKLGLSIQTTDAGMSKWFAQVAARAA